jgi:hypothetical protein
MTMNIGPNCEIQYIITTLFDCILFYFIININISHCYNNYYNKKKNYTFVDLFLITIIVGNNITITTFFCNCNFYL